VGDDLGVGVRGEHASLLGQAIAQGHVVLDDPVEHDVDLVGGVVVGMGVLLAHAAVRRPAGMADARGRGPGRDRHRALAGRGADRLAQGGQVADRPHRLDVAVADHRDAGAVVTPVLELLEPSQEQLLDGAVTDVADDAAHGWSPEL
jgi:hypothetical protein